MTGFAALVVLLSRIADLGVTRVLLFGAAALALAIFAAMAARSIAVSRGLRPLAGSAGEQGSEGGLAKLREKVIGASFSAWDRMELAGRLRVSLRRLNQCVGRTPEAVAQDELRLAALQEAPVSRRHSAPRAVEPAESVLTLVEGWEARLHRRPEGGR